MNNDAPLYPMPTEEEARLRALEEYQLVDTPQAGDLDRLAELAAHLFNVPIVTISLVAKHKVFLKARIGFDLNEVRREISLCSHTITQKEVLFIPDMLKDSRFCTNPYVTGSPFFRFYAGKSLITPSGEVIGSICLIDYEPRASFSEEERKNLISIADFIMERMELRRLDQLKSIDRIRFDQLADASRDAIILSDAKGRITFWNRSAERIFGYRAEEMLGKPSTFLLTENRRSSYSAELQKLRRGEKEELGSKTISLLGLRKNGREFPAEFLLSRWDEGESISIGTIVRDISERRRNEERLFQLAALDSLTHLSSRGAWNARLEQTLASAMPVAILLLDLNGFKEINDTLGHSAGDSVLVEVATRIKSESGAALMMARLGGDEFAILLAGNDPQVAQDAAKRLIAAISAPFRFAGRTIEVGVSVGIALAPTHSNHPEELLSNADLALYRAKATGNKRYEMFMPDFREKAIVQRAFEQELRLAFENGEFELFYQPQVSSRTRQVTGAEALIRWHHPERGLLSPVAFIDVLIQKPSASAVGEWVLRTACAAAAEWRKKIPDFRIGVNLFEAQLNSMELASVVQQVLDQTGMPGSALELEIVENILVHNDEKTLQLLHRLREQGVGLAFDDYGTGFASLGLLKRCPVSRLKIDKSFIHNIESDAENSALVKAILYLGKSFQLDITAEGVETQEQLDFLIENECFEVQGYLFGVPMPAAEFTARFVDPS